MASIFEELQRDLGGGAPRAIDTPRPAALADDALPALGPVRTKDPADAPAARALQREMYQQYNPPGAPQKRNADASAIRTAEQQPDGGGMLPISSVVEGTQRNGALDRPAGPAGEAPVGGRQSAIQLSRPAPRSGAPTTGLFSDLSADLALPAPAAPAGTTADAPAKVGDMKEGFEKFLGTALLNIFEGDPARRGKPRTLSEIGGDLISAWGKSAKRGAQEDAGVKLDPITQQPITGVQRKMSPDTVRQLYSEYSQEIFDNQRKVDRTSSDEEIANRIARAARAGDESMIGPELLAKPPVKSLPAHARSGRGLDVAENVVRSGVGGAPMRIMNSMDQARAGLMWFAGETVGNEDLVKSGSEAWKDAKGAGKEIAKDSPLSVASKVPEMVAGGIDSIPLSLLSGGAYAALGGARGATVGLTPFFLQSAGQTYGEMREQKFGHAYSTLISTLMGGSEVGTELIALPAMATLLKSQQGKIIENGLNALWKEGGTEAINAVAQGIFSKASTKPDYSVKDVLEDVQAAVVASGVTVGAMGALGGTTGLARRVFTRTEDPEIRRDRVKDTFKDQLAGLPPEKQDAAVDTFLERYDRDQAAVREAAKAKDAAPTFTPTHRLDDGTPVRQHTESDGGPAAGVWKTEDGEIVEAPRADPLSKPDANAEMRTGGVPYEVTVVGKGREKDTARLADGQEVPIGEIESMGDEAKKVLGLLPPEETKPAKAATKAAKTETKAAPAATKTPVDDTPAVSAAAARPTVNIYESQEAAQAEASKVAGGKAVPADEMRYPGKWRVEVTKPEQASPVEPQESPKLGEDRSREDQNRERGSAVSIDQMKGIAANPDYDRLSASKAPESGAPMVSIAADADVIPSEQLGKQSVVTLDGVKVPIRYAVVEADDLIASHTVDGDERPEYFAARQSGQIRSLNNGRAAGVREAYALGTADRYRAAMAEDPDHGISATSIAKMKSPVLVRVYSDQFNKSIKNIGEKSQGETLGQSPVELALQDAAKLGETELALLGDAEGVKKADAFVNMFMQKIVSKKDRGNLVDTETDEPGKAAYDRMEAAIFQKAYHSRALTRLFAEAADEEVRTVLNALTIAAPEMAKLEGVPKELDIRPFIADAAALFVKAKRLKTTIDKLLKQGDFNQNDLVIGFAGLMAKHRRSGVRMGEALREGAKWAQWAARQADTPDIFGVSPKYGIGDALKNMQKFEDQENGQAEGGRRNEAAQTRAPYEAGQGTKAAASPGGEPAGGADERSRKQAAVDAAREREGAESGTVRQGAETEVGDLERPTLKLKGETPEELKAKMEAAAKPEPEAKAPPTKNVTADQGDLFNDQLSLFQDRAGYDVATTEAAAMIEENGWKTVGDAFDWMTDDRSHGDEFLAEAARELYDEGERDNRDVQRYVAAAIVRGQELMGTVDEAAAEAQGHLASEAQQDVGNYQKGHVTFNAGTPLAMEVSIENAAGTRRRPEWPALKDHYGYFKNTVAHDSEPGNQQGLDVFIKPGAPLNWTGPVFVVNQQKADGTFDEHKSLIGYSSLAEARAAYQRNYEEGWDRGRSIVPITMPAFKAWATDASKNGPRGGQLKLSTAKVLDATHAAGANVPSFTAQPAQSDLFSATPVPGTPALAFEKIVVGTQRVGSISLPAGQVNNAEQAAQAFQQLRKYPRERFQILGLNERNEPVAFFDLFAGTLTATSAYPREVFTAVYQTPGITKVWLAHQHPGGRAEPSTPDRALTVNLMKGFGDKAGIQMAGHIIIAGDQAVLLKGDGTNDQAFTVPPLPAATQTVPLMERMIEREDINRGERITTTDGIKQELQKLSPKEPGLLVLDAQNRPIAWWPMSLAEMSKLKTGDISTGMARLFRQVGRNNPGHAVAYTPNPIPEGSGRKVFANAVRNVAAALNLVDVYMLDAMQPDPANPGQLLNYASTVRQRLSGGDNFYRLGEQTTEAVTADDARGEIATNPVFTALGSHVEVLESPYHLPDDILTDLINDGQVSFAKAIFHPRTGKIYLLASNLERGEAEIYLAHEAVGHMGIFNVLPREAGMPLREAFLDVYRSRSADIRREARSGFLNPYRLDLRNTEHQVTASAEWIAHMSEQGIEQTLWQKIAGAVRAALRKAGFVREWSDNDILRLLKLSRLSLTNANGRSVNGMPPLMAALQSAPVTYATDDNGPYLGAGDVLINEPKQYDRIGDTTFYEHVITDVAGKPMGLVSLGWEAGRVTQMTNIRAFSQRSGLGTRVLDMIMAHNGPGSQLYVRWIQPEAREFWEKVGTDIFATEEGEDGTLTAEGFAAAIDAREASRGAGREGEAPAVGTPVDGGQAGRAGAGEARAPLRQLYALRQPTGVSEVYGVREGRLLGLAAKANGGVWNVYLANGSNETLFATGQFRRMQAASLNEVNRIFATAGLELNVTKPRNIPVPDRSIFDQDWAAPQADTWFKRATIYLQNRLLLSRQYEEAITKAVGPLPENAKAYREARIAHPRSATGIADFDFANTQPLIDVMRRLRLSLKDVGQYLYALHAAERNAAIEEINPENKTGSGISDERAEQIKQGLRDRGIWDALERDVRPIINRIRTEREQLMLDKGLATRESIELMRAKYPNYVPLKDIVEDEFAQDQVTPGFGIRKPFQAAFGRWTEAQAEFILPGLIAQAKGTIAAGENAEVLRQLLRQMSFAPNPGVWKLQKVSFKPSIDKDTGMVVYRPHPVMTDRNLRERTISVPVNGVYQNIVVTDPDLAKVFNESGLPVPEAMRLVGTVTRFYALTATALNPEFIATNFLRDFQTAVARLGAENGAKLAAKVARDALPAMWGAFRGLRSDGQAGPDAGQWQREYRRYIKAGGHVAYRGMVDTETQHQDFLVALADAGIMPEAASGIDRVRLRAHRAVALTGVKAVGKMVLDLNGAVENALRLAAFKNAIEAGFSEKDAAFLARNVTVDFNLQGEATKFWGSMYVFLNATIQSNALLFRSFVNSRAFKAVALGLFFMGAGMDWWNRRRSKKTEEGRTHYDNVSPWVRQKHIIIMADGENAVTIPLALGLNVFYLAGANAMSVADKAKTPLKAAIETLVALIDVAQPFGSTPTTKLGILQFIAPTAIDTPVQMITNQTFAEKKIAPERLPFGTPMADSARFWPKTPEHWIAISDWLNRRDMMGMATPGNDVRGGALSVSPNMLQHFARSIFGSAGGFVSRVVEAAATKASGEKLATKDTPFLRRFIQEPNDVELQQRFHENLNNAEIAHYEVKLALESGKLDLAGRLKDEFVEERSMFGEAQATEKRVADLRKQAAAVRRSNQLDKDQKAASIEKIDEQTALAMKEFNSRYNERTEK